jgi:glycosyltransferase involved in cell wall biosynthesis
MTDSGPLRITGCVITLNEEACIRSCLESMSLCDELVVVDAHSTDATRDIAASLGAHVIERDWPGYRSQKQFAVEAASHDWVLILDADEQLSPALAAEVAALRVKGPGNFAAFDAPRLSRYFGRYLHHGDFYPPTARSAFSTGGGRGSPASRSTSASPWTAGSVACVATSCTTPSATSTTSSPNDRPTRG